MEQEERSVFVMSSSSSSPIVRPAGSQRTIPKVSNVLQTNLVFSLIPFLDCSNNTFIFRKEYRDSFPELANNQHFFLYLHQFSHFSPITLLTHTDMWVQILIPSSNNCAYIQVVTTVVVDQYNSSTGRRRISIY